MNTKGILICFFIIAIIFNFFNRFRNLKVVNVFLRGTRDWSSLIFFVFDILIILIGNVLFMYMNISFSNSNILIVIFIVSIIFSAKSRRYSCISYSSIFTIFIFELLNINVDIGSVLKLVGYVHILEGIFIITKLHDCRSYFLTKKEEDTYLSYLSKFGILFPLFLNVNGVMFPFIFYIFYRRKAYKNLLYGRIYLYLGLNLLYGIIVLIGSFLLFNVYFKVLMLCFTVVFHEAIFFIEKFLEDRFGVLIKVYDDEMVITYVRLFSKAYRRGFRMYDRILKIEEKEKNYFFVDLIDIRGNSKKIKLHTIEKNTIKVI